MMQEKLILDMGVESASETIQIKEIEIIDRKPKTYGVVVIRKGTSTTINLEAKELGIFCSAMTNHTEADIRRQAVFSWSVEGLPTDIVGDHKVTRRWIKRYLD